MQFDTVIKYLPTDINKHQWSFLLVGRYISTHICIFIFCVFYCVCFVVRINILDSILFYIASQHSSTFYTMFEYVS